MWEILTKLVDEDPCLKVEHVASTNETIVYGLGELHLRVLLERLREVYKFEVNTRPPRIAYRETITAPAEGPPPPQEADRRRRAVRRGLPAHRAPAARRRVRVRRRGQGRRDPNQFIPAVEKGVREVLVHGAIAGYPVVDVRVVVYDGKHHSVDSKEIAFVTPAARPSWRPSARPGPSCSNPSCTSRSAPRTAPWATSPATCRPPRPGQRHRQRGRRHGRRQGPGADVGAGRATRTASTR
jgi:translation elongation factor EF-G